MNLEYDDRICIACEACLDNCHLRVSNALRIENYKIIRDEEYCMKCGECILKCPAGAFYCDKKFYRIIVGGRTGKKNPRLANTFIKDTNEKVVLAVCKSLYSFIHRHIDCSLPKEHLGYIIDLVGFDKFAHEITESISMNSEAEVVKSEQKQEQGVNKFILFLLVYYRN